MLRAVNRLIWMVLCDGDRVSEDYRLVCGTYNAVLITAVAAGLIYGTIKIVSSAG